jgi:hypothetical protein
MEMSNVIKKNPIEAIVITTRECGPLGRPTVRAVGRLLALTDIGSKLSLLDLNGVQASVYPES